MAKDEVWITRKGKRIPVEDMETSHIKNAIDMLEKQRKTDINIYGYLIKELEKRIEEENGPEEIEDRSEILDLD